MDRKLVQEFTTREIDNEFKIDATKNRQCRKLSTYAQPA